MTDTASEEVRKFKPGDLVEYKGVLYNVWVVRDFEEGQGLAVGVFYDPNDAHLHDPIVCEDENGEEVVYATGRVAQLWGPYVRAVRDFDHYEQMMADDQRKG